MPPSWTSPPKINTERLMEIVRNYLYLSDAQCDFIVNVIKEKEERESTPPRAASIPSDQKRKLRPVLTEDQMLCHPVSVEELAKEVEEKKVEQVHPQELVSGVRPVDFIPTSVTSIYSPFDGEIVTWSRKGILFRVKVGTGSVDKWLPKSQMVYCTTNKKYYVQKWVLEANGLLSKEPNVGKVVFE